jgi:hypothetical protein
MNSPPHGEQLRALTLDLLDHAAQITSADTDDPIDPDPIWSFEHDLRLASVPKHMHVRRAVIVRKNHEPEAVRAVHRRHQNNPSKLGFQE